MWKKNYFVLLCFLFTAAIANNNHENYSLMDDFYMNLHVHKDSVADISDKYMKSVLGYDFSSRYSDSDEEIIDSDGDIYSIDVEIYKDFDNYYAIKKIIYFAFMASGNVDIIADCVFENNKIKWINVYESSNLESFSEPGSEYTESCYRFYFDDDEKCIISRTKSKTGSIEDMESVSKALDSIEFSEDPIPNNNILLEIKKILDLCK